MMGRETTLEITGELYKRVERLAAWRDQSITDALQEMLTVAENRIALLDDEAQMDFEEAAYEIQHKELFKEFAGQYVAIHKGKLVDHDKDELSLYRRINSRFPHDVVLLKKVQEWPEPDLYYRSPRFFREE